MAEKTGRGRPPKPARLRRTRRLPLLLTTAEHMILNRYCARHNVSANEVIRRSLKQFLVAESSEPVSGGQEKKGDKR